MFPPALSLKLHLAGEQAPAAVQSPHLLSPGRLILSPRLSPRLHNNNASILATSASILSLTHLSDTDPLLRASRRHNTANITTLLVPFPSHTITHYVNLPAQRDGNTPLHSAIVSAAAGGGVGSGGLFPVVQLLLSYGADPNRLNSAHCTALHLACETGREDVIVVLLVHGADPRLVNSRGQRCWETKAGQAAAVAGERSKLEILVKRVWEDLRREKERAIMAAVTAATNNSLLSPGGAFSGATALAAKPPTPAFFTREHYQHDWYDTHTTNSLRSMLSQADEPTPLLAKALLWDESLREKEQQQQRVRADEERRHVTQRHSLLHHMQRTMNESDQVLQERRQRRQTIRSGDPNASLLAQQQLWREQEQQRHRLHQQQLAASQQSKQLYARLQQAEDAGRVHEIRAVMNEYERLQVPGKRERVLRQMRRNSLWSVVEDRRRNKDKQEREGKQRPTSAGGMSGRRGGDAYAFMTEPEGQEADPVPTDHEQQRREEEEKAQEEEGSELSEKEKAELAALKDPKYFPPVPIKLHTRAYLSRSLTEHMTMVPPPPHLLPMALQTVPTVDYPPVTLRTQHKQEEEQKESASSAVGEKQKKGVVWRDPTWQPTIGSGTNKPAGGEMVSSGQKDAPRRHHSMRKAAARSHRSAALVSEGERQEAVLLSAYIMREVDISLRKRDNSRQSTSDQHSIEERKQLIQNALPDLSPDSSLYATLLASTNPVRQATMSAPPFDHSRVDDFSLIVAVAPLLQSAVEET